MTNKLMIAALLALSLAAPVAAYAGEGNGEPFPLNISVSTAPDHQVVVSTLPLTDGLPVGALNGTLAYQQAQSLNRWYAQQADHRFAQQQARQAHTNG